MIDLSVVIISWRMKEMLQQLLLSVLQFTQGITYEIIVIDNNSRDGTSETVRKNFPHVTLIENSENRGVAPSRNQGLRIARGRYVVTLDADMVLKENSLKILVDFMDATPDAGLAGCKLVFPNDVVQPSGRRFPTPLALILRRLHFLKVARNSKTLRNHEMADWDRRDVRTVDYVIGACQIIRRTAMEKVGLLDDKIFYGPEDIDYCLRMQKVGWKVYYVPLTSIVHFEQRVTKRKLFTRLSWLHLKGILYLFWKYRGRVSVHSSE